MAALGSRRKSSDGQSFEIPRDGSWVDRVGARAALAAEGLELAQVPAVGVERIAPEPALDRLARQMAVDDLVPIGRFQAVACSAGSSSSLARSVSRNSRMRSRSVILFPARSLT